MAPAFDASLAYGNAVAKDPMARQALTRSIAALGDRQRTAIVLRYYGERSTREIDESR